MVPQAMSEHSNERQVASILSLPKLVFLKWHKLTQAICDVIQPLSSKLKWWVLPYLVKESCFSNGMIYCFGDVCYTYIQGLNEWMSILMWQDLKAC